MPAELRWGNVPVPETHLAGLGAGALLQLVRPWRPPWPGWAGQVCGWPLFAGGVWLGAWAVRAAGTVDLERPGQLVRSGPYVRSRTPMYVAWTLAYAGSALIARAAWPLALLPPVVAVTDVLVRREERSLERRFGSAYRNYKASVRRYL